jgi:hypothetical protein
MVIRKFTMLYFLTLFATLAGTLHPVDMFVQTRTIPEDNLAPGVSSILVRLGTALAELERTMNFTSSTAFDNIINRFKWEVEMHEYLENAKFPTVGHFHLHSGAEISPFVSLFSQIAAYQVNREVRVGVDKGDSCESLRSLELEGMQLFCASPEEFPAQSLHMALGTVETVVAWTDKVEVGGVVFGTGKILKEIVAWRKWREIFLAEQDLFWWFRDE